MTPKQERDAAEHRAIVYLREQLASLKAANSVPKGSEARQRHEDLAHQSHVAYLEQVELIHYFSQVIEGKIDIEGNAIA